MKLDSSISAIITGGASGLGEATARGLATLGVKITLFDLNEEQGTALAKELNGVFCQVDVADEGSVTAGFKTARAAYGQERILINCAGIAAAMGTIIEDGSPHSINYFKQVLNINLLGTFNCIAQSAAGICTTEPVTADGERGVIINTASIAAFDGPEGQAAYSASKAGIVGMTLPIARDLSHHGIRVNTIAPGLFYTPMLSKMPQPVQDALAAQIPFPARLGHPAEYASMARQICENSMVNGETIRLDAAIRLNPR